MSLNKESIWDQIPDASPTLDTLQFRVDPVIELYRRFEAAPDCALFDDPEVAVILNCSLSWLQKGHGPEVTWLGRSRKRSKLSIKKYAASKTPEVPDPGEEDRQ